MPVYKATFGDGTEVTVEAENAAHAAMVAEAKHPEFHELRFPSEGASVIKLEKLATKS